ncbi:MAG: hypothetical protein AMJ73_06155, partial [candidate division Zixibacteria bacterium SM1_73]
MRKYFVYLLIFSIIGVGDSFASSLDITYRGYGISIGNSKRINGMRLNLVDSGVERINGLNLTFWKPKDNPYAVMNGFTFGLVAPAAKELNGLALGGVAVVGEKINGVAFGTIGLASDTVRGIAIGGIGMACGSIDGIAFGSVGLADWSING